MEKDVVVLTPIDIQACKSLYEHGKVSKALLQRRLKISFEDAEKIIFKLIKAEILSPYVEGECEIIMSVTKFWQLIGEKGNI